MRKFIVSDLHGNGDVYDAIISFLEGLDEPVELYINGDLIDRGEDSFRMLMDVMERVNHPSNLIIYYLGGNHELMMYQAISKRKSGRKIPFWCNWFQNGGRITNSKIEENINKEELYSHIHSFLSKLEIYHVFDEKIKDENLLLVHAQAPRKFIPMKIGDCNWKVSSAVWTRKRDDFGFYHSLGKKGNFTIVGHTPVLKGDGFLISSSEKVMNIDGGCACYAVGGHWCDHVPLLEIEDGYVSIFIFQHQGQITKAYVYDGVLYPMSDEELKLKSKYKSKKLLKT